MTDAKKEDKNSALAIKGVNGNWAVMFKGMMVLFPFFSLVLCGLLGFGLKEIIDQGKQVQTNVANIIGLQQAESGFTLAESQLDDAMLKAEITEETDIKIERAVTQIKADFDNFESRIVEAIEAIQSRGNRGNQ